MANILSFHILKQSVPWGRCLLKSFSTLQKNRVESIMSLGANKSVDETLLQPLPCTLVLSCGMKTKGWVKKRCVFCYLVARDGRMFNYCKVHPRHNQMSKRAPNRWYYTLTGVETYTRRKW